ncbi:MAG: hypothetical protein Q4E75_06155 [bacterium]|nr:hypothetical protein [bacterium]
MNNIENKWLECLVKLYEKELMLNKGIFEGSKKEQLLGNLEVLEEARKRVMETKNKELEKLYKEFYYDLFIIKEDNIPYSVYEAEVKLARERGYGNIPITDEYKKEKNKSIIQDQKESLDKWLEYFIYDEEAKTYKSWEVFWVLEGLQKLGKYDKEKHKYTKRDKTTVYPYPEVNKVAIFNTINLMEEYLKDKKGPEELKSALGQGNFKQLYEYSIEQQMLQGERKDNGIEGKWIKYDQGSDYHKLRDSLQGYKTGWCTAAGESFAKEQLEDGDFYVYYSVDENGEYKIPRIAIRMNGHAKIAEIRGIEQNQNLEPEMLPILDEKLKEFPDKDKYLKKEHDMKKLTEIDNKINQGLELTQEELKFLYEIDSKIEGFGWNNDPRIEEIKERIQKRDYSKIYNCKEEEIALNQEEWEQNPKQFKVLVEDLDIYGLTSAEGLVLPQTLVGKLWLEDLTSAESLVLPQTVVGDLDLSGLTDANDLVLPKTVGGALYLYSLTSAKGLKLPQTVGGSLELSTLTDADDLVLPETVGGALYLPSLTSAKSLKLPKTVVGYLNLRNLISTECLIIPDPLTYTIHMCGFDITPENVEECRKKQIR